MNRNKPGKTVDLKEEELKYRDVAEILGISQKTVESQLAIAIKKIGSSINFDISKAIAAPHGLPK